MNNFLSDENFKIFILEDNPERIKIFKTDLARNYPNAKLFFTDTVDEAKKLFENNKPFDVYFLDHDLGGKVYVDSEDLNTGYQFAKFLKSNNVDGKNEKIFIHTLNPIGGNNMKNVLPSAQRVFLFTF